MPRTRRLVCTLIALAVALPAADTPKKAKAAKTETGPARWEETIKRFEAADAASPPAKGAVLLVGGSNARRWTDVQAYFPGEAILNRGFGGAQLAEVLHFADRIVLPYAPRTIILNAGGNDISAGLTPGQLAAAATAFAAKVRAALPRTKIIQVSLPPTRRGTGTPEGLAALRVLNARLAEAARATGNMEFVDIVPALLDAQGRHRPELFIEDGTHFSPAGYTIVAGLLRGKL